MPARLLVLWFATTCSGCATVSYFAQALHGHAAVMWRAQPVDALLRDPALAPALRHKLELSQAARAFATSQLGLPANRSYTKYADLGREHVVWNVFATPALSLQPIKSCFPLVGCLPYRGYFQSEAAHQAAQSLAAAGHDVYVGGVAAYSTLGWFADPLLNTMTRWDDGRLVQVLFHELAHQKLYCRNDSDFNEAYATAVARLGYRVWIEHTLPANERRRALDADQRDDEFVSLLLATRKRLQTVYDSAQSDAAKLTAKQEVLAALRENYRLWRDRWHGYSGYDTWLEQDLNNAKLASIATYHDLVPAFIELFRISGSDYERFYRNAEWLAQRPAAERTVCLRILLPAADDAVAACPYIARQTRLLPRGI
ncbi:MAG: aminopeptidase [Gammaproteobacteria bacterium]|nr:aminopeptidase [Gammaproteobacteria bacterium]